MNFFRSKCKKIAITMPTGSLIVHRPQELQMAGDKKGAEQRGGGVSALSHLGWGIVNSSRCQGEPSPL